jgi:hypothetical protein
VLASTENSETEPARLAVASSPPPGLNATESGVDAVPNGEPETGLTAGRRPHRARRGGQRRQRGRQLPWLGAEIRRRSGTASELRTASTSTESRISSRGQSRSRDAAKDRIPIDFPDTADRQCDGPDEKKRVSATQRPRRLDHRHPAPYRHHTRRSRALSTTRPDMPGGAASASSAATRPTPTVGEASVRSIRADSRRKRGPGRTYRIRCLPMQSRSTPTALTPAPMVALVARCETDVVYGAETCFRVGACTRSQRGRRHSLCPDPAV